MLMFWKVWLVIMIIIIAFNYKSVSQQHEYTTLDNCEKVKYILDNQEDWSLTGVNNALEYKNNFCENETKEGIIL